MIKSNGRKDQALDIVIGSSFKHYDEPIFTLSSGEMSKYYIDCREAMSFPDNREIFSEVILDALSGIEFDCIGGPATGSIPISIGLSGHIYRLYGNVIPVFWVREKWKKHGIRGNMAGHEKTEGKAVIVDDVSTSGDSVIRAIKECYDSKINVAKVVVLVDRQEGAKEKIEEYADFESIFTLQDLKDKLQLINE